MVEKNVAYNRDNREQEFADNDPLAQLARLVGQEDRPSHVAPPAAQQPVERREPEFNLEDELLREFAIYDSPRYEPVALDAANDVRSPVPAGEFMQRVESVFARKEPELEPVEQYAPADTEEYLVAEHAASSDLRDDFSDDPDSVAALFDVAHRLTANHPDMQPEPVAVHEEPAAYVEPEAYVEPVAAAEVSQEVSYQEPVSPAPVMDAPVQPQNDPSASHQPDWELMAETSGEAAIDLASELEMSVAEELPAPVPASPPLARRSSLDYSSLRLPLANFGAPRATPVAPKPAEPVALAAQFTQPLEAPANHVEPAIPAGQKMSAMDELIYDVAKYEISSRDVIAAMPAARLEPVVAVAPPVSVAPTPVTPAHVVPTPARTEPSFQQPAAQEEPDLGEFDAFKDDDFELALDDIDFDIDLSEIANIDVPVAPVEKPVAAAPPAPVAQAPVVPKPVVAAPAPAPVATPVAAVTARPQQVVAATAAAAAAPRQEAPRPAPVVAAPPATLESLPFDPSQIGETEDQPETITEMEVPELPVGVFEPKPAPRRQEEDLDLDTELASLFAPAVTGGLDRNKNAAAPRQPQPTQDEVDEFERALEQDFRRSMQEAAETRASGGERHAPADFHEPVRYSDEERGGVRRWLVPVAAVLGVVLVGGGTYALMFGGSAGQGSNGAPVIIAADSEPTKVVPENPGGRVVPNQDKAVYDRVAGSAPADPKQPSLISTNEQPVDVVQRTLIPEQLPLEGENEEMETASSTPVGETEDPRLLSPDEKAQAAENQGGSPVNVSPRKVRTMIVKPDGTLVAQEVAAPATPVPQADKVEELAAPQATAAAERAPAVISASRVPVTPEQPAQPQAQTPAPAATAPKPAQTAAPLPGSRPSAQPANVVATVSNQGNVRPAPPSQPAQETAAAPTPTTNASSTGGYYVQVASLPSQAEAQKSYQNLSTKFASVIGGRGVDIKAAEIAGKGTFYRVRIPAGDKNEAAALCERFRSAGGSCLIAR